MRVLLSGFLPLAASMLLLCGFCVGAGEDERPQSARSSSATATPPTETAGADDAQREILSGKVVLLVDALKSRGVKTYAEELKGQVVLVTSTKELVPIVPDWRGRALYQDERLRNRPVDLVVNRRPGIPWVQVLSIYTFDEHGKRQITDYWCDVCSIPMYEIKDCECCQGPTRLRFRPQELPQLKPAPEK
ncbi:MAG: hypothetical protein JSS02_28410 [Planctomycetes bacterium]|nr:hypothetical protein [Planctomycetota bacterium]